MQGGGYSHTKGWIFGYKLHLTSSSSSTTARKIIVSLTADKTTVNVPDNKMYIPLTSSSLVFSLLSLRYMVADPGYDDKKLYEYSKSIGNRFGLSSVERYEIFQKEA
jgi:hypothetical protein